MAREEIVAWMEKNQVTVDWEFVPYSKSRSAQPGSDFKGPNLNWKVTVCRYGKPVLVTDYSAGEGHCQSRLAKGVLVTRVSTSDLRRARVQECETGYAVEVFPNGYFGPKLKERASPDPVDVLSSMALDAGVLDFSCFEDWAEEFGYDPDSRKAEGIYNECLKIALTLRNAFGDAPLKALQEACHDY